MNVDTITLVNLFCLGLVGSVDEIFFHHLKHKLFTRRESFSENLAHTARFLVYAVVFFTVANLELRGGWAWAMLGIIFLDGVVGLTDVLLERKSRASLGGMTTAEYTLHMLLSFGLGLFYFQYVSALWMAAHEPTGLILAIRDNLVLQCALSFMASIGFLMFVFSCYYLIRQKRRFSQQ